jgi:hypothetical protein
MRGSRLTPVICTRCDKELASGNATLPPGDLLNRAETAVLLVTLLHTPAPASVGTEDRAPLRRNEIKARTAELRAAGKFRGA